MSSLELCLLSHVYLLWLSLLYLISGHKSFKKINNTPVIFVFLQTSVYLLFLVPKYTLKWTRTYSEMDTHTQQLQTPQTCRLAVLLMLLSGAHSEDADLFCGLLWRCEHMKSAQTQKIWGMGTSTQSHKGSLRTHIWGKYNFGFNQMGC